MKKIFYLLLTLVATSSLWASNVITYTATSKLPETTSTYSSGLHTNAFNVSISSHTFDNGIGTITFAGEITTIGDYAFYNCNSLTSITIPNSVTSIGNYAFRYCSGLASITIPHSVITIGNWAFHECSGLTSINVESTCMHYSSIDGVLFNYTKDTLIQYPISKVGSSYIVPNSVITIGGSAFHGCKGLTSITIPSSITTIERSAFESCSGMTLINVDALNTHYSSVDGVLFTYAKDTLIQYPIGNTRITYTIPNSVAKIEWGAFANCGNLTSVEIPNSVTTIGDAAFSDCSGLTSVTIGNSVTTIGSYAFSYCSGMTSIIIPNSVTTIGDAAFSDCSGLTSVTIGNSVTTIGKYVFERCSGLTSVTIGNSVTTIEDEAFALCSGLTSVTLGNSVTTLRERAFYNCKGLTLVTIPNSVTEIGRYAFEYCTGLTSITCLAINPPSLGYKVFYNVPRYIPLYVYASSIPAYQAATEWQEFNIQPLLVDVDPIASDTTQLSWLPVDSASLYKLRIFSEQIALDTTLMIEADSLNGGISIPVTLASQRVRRMPMDDIGSVVVITLEPNSGATKEIPFVVTVSTKSKDKIDIGFDLTVLKGETTIKQESGSFTLNAPIPDGLEDVPMSRFGVSSGIYDLYGRHYLLNQWNNLPEGIYILRDGEKASKVMKQ